MDLPLVLHGVYSHVPRLYNHLIRVILTYSCKLWCMSSNMHASSPAVRAHMASDMDAFSPGSGVQRLTIGIQLIWIHPLLPV